MTVRIGTGSSTGRRSSRSGVVALVMSAALAAGCADDGAPSARSDVESTSVETLETVETTAGATTTTNDDDASSTTARATTTPAPSTEMVSVPSVRLEPLGRYDQPVDLASRPGDDARYVVERTGRVLAVGDDATRGVTVLDLSDATRGEGEQGLLGLTFSQRGDLAYVNHTDLAGDTVIAEYRVGVDGQFVETSRRVLLEIDQPYANHNGGSLTIGPDGMLWIGMGDGGAGGDPERRALDLSTLLGKILRIDPTPSGDRPYSIPTDNPFIDTDDARPEIWSIGVRNPWRMSFDRDTGDLWFGDVGEREVEEIDVARAADGTGRGANWGWSAFEGTRRFNEDQPTTGAVAPLYEYDHGAGCSVTGGEVYRGSALPALNGWYVFGDFCTGELSALNADDQGIRVIALARLEALSAIRSGPDGELYALSLNGPVARLVADR